MASVKGSPSPSTESKAESTKGEEVLQTVQEVAVVERSPSQGTKRTQPLRSLPPFIASHDIPRGALFAFQALLYSILMLAVM